jgi:hypothetical protein
LDFLQGIQFKFWNPPNKKPTMKSITQRPGFQIGVLLALFAIGSSIGLRDRYYKRLAGRYLTEKGLGLARAYARDFEEQHGNLPSMEDLIPFAEKRFHDDLQRMNFSPVGDHFTWMEDTKP